MTLDEQDAILGRMAREYKEAKVRLVALEAKAKFVGDTLENLGRQIRYNTPQQELFTPENFPKFTQAELLALVVELNEVNALVRDLRERLISAGLPPAD